MLLLLGPPLVVLLLGLHVVPDQYTHALNQWLDNKTTCGLEQADRQTVGDANPTGRYANIVMKFCIIL